MSEELANATKDLSLENKAEAAAPEAPAAETGGEAATVLSGEEFEVKHPLNTRWTLWYTKPQGRANESWADLLKPVISFGSVEEFWGIFNSIPSAVELPLKADYHLFREGIRPEWEDPANANGGKWTFTFNNKNATDINDIWLRSLLSVIGETIEQDEALVNGVVFNNKKFGYRVSLWTSSVEKSKMLPIGETFKKVLTLQDDSSIELWSHKDAEAKGSKASMVI